eukprot:GGOE01001177.1.p1 GENE.GGOE01001177.1~~GGOE01001177.1.p1  ORF type:complete len:814 (+),score=196.63 GGOE01001177.1:155-2443(+)
MYHVEFRLVGCSPLSFTIICPPVDETVRYSRSFKPLGITPGPTVPDSISERDLQTMRGALQRMFIKANVPEERQAEMLASVAQRKENPEHEFCLLLEVYEAVATMRIIACTESPRRAPKAADSTPSVVPTATPQPLRRPASQSSPQVPRRPAMTSPVGRGRVQPKRTTTRIDVSTDSSSSQEPKATQTSQPSQQQPSQRPPAAQQVSLGTTMEGQLTSTSMETVDVGPTALEVEFELAPLLEERTSFSRLERPRQETLPFTQHTVERMRLEVLPESASDSSSSDEEGEQPAIMEHDGGDSPECVGCAHCCAGPHLPEIEIQTQIIPVSRPSSGQSPGTGLRRGSWLSPSAFTLQASPAPPSFPASTVLTPSHPLAATPQATPWGAAPDVVPPAVHLSDLAQGYTLFPPVSPVRSASPYLTRLSPYAPPPMASVLHSPASQRLSSPQSPPLAISLHPHESPIQTSPQQPAFRFSSPSLDRSQPPLAPPQPVNYYYPTLPLAAYPSRPSISFVSTAPYMPPPGRFSSPFISPFSGPLFRLEDMAGSLYYSQFSQPPTPTLQLSTSFGSQFGSQVSFLNTGDRFSQQPIPPQQSLTNTVNTMKNDDRWSSGPYPLIPIMQETIQVPPPLQFFPQQLSGFSQVYTVSQAVLPPPSFQPPLPQATQAAPVQHTAPATQLTTAASAPQLTLVPPTPARAAPMELSAGVLPPLIPPPPVSCAAPEASPTASDFGCTTRKRVNIRRGCGRCHCCVQAQARALLDQPGAGL